MPHPHRLLLAAALLTAIACGGAAAPASAARGPAAVAAAPGPAATATAYLQARTAAVTAADPGSVLMRWATPGGRLAASERAVARGTALRATRLGHRIDSLTSEVTVLDTARGPEPDMATVTARVVTSMLWHSVGAARSIEACGVDHTVALQRVGGAWQVIDDKYVDVMAPAYLEAAGASPSAVRRAVRRLESAGTPHVVAAVPRQSRGPSSSRARRYADVLVYDRAAAAAYADRYALSYNPGYVRFSADCADFASQGARAGGMPVNAGGFSEGWWYDKNGTASPGDDSYSLSWINVPKQMSFWNARRTDWATSIDALGKGDFVYYDWSGDGAWDHVAVVVGTNSAGQKVVDAHTADLYHAYWKLGSSSTHYKFARVRAQWVV